MPTFPADVVTAVLTHMNSDHRDDNIMIVRAFADRDADSATMTSLDESAGYWAYSVAGDSAAGDIVAGLSAAGHSIAGHSVAGHSRELRIPWTATISERAEIRREIVTLYENACIVLTKP